MILFVNVKITQTFNYRYERGLLDRPERYKIFCYTLSSYAVIPWSAVRLYIEFDDSQIQHQDFVLDYARRLFPDALIKTQRLYYQNEWKEAILELGEMDDKLIWFTGNDDHPFIDSSLDTLLALEKRMLQIAECYPYVSSPFSHWPEMMPRTLDDFLYYNADNGFLMVDGFWNNTSVQILSYDMLKSWFFDLNLYDIKVARSEVPITYCIGVAIIPLREIVRHFDGYSHSGLDIAICPPLSIPDGFFEHNIRLCYGGTPEKGITLVDPLNPNHAAVAADGADWQSTLDEIPLFWQSAVSETKIVRSPTEKDRTETRIKQMRVAASGSILHDGFLRLHDLMSRAQGGSFLTPSELASGQSSLNRSFMTRLRQRGLLVHRLNDRTHQVTVSVIIEDIGRQTGVQPRIDFSSPRESCVELVWLTSGHLTSVGKEMEYADTVASFPLAYLACDPATRPVFWLEASLSLALGDVMLWFIPPTPPIKQDTVLMFRKQTVLEQLFVSLYVEKKEIVKLQLLNDGVLTIVGIVALRHTVVRLVGDQFIDREMDKITAARFRFECLSKTVIERMNEIKNLEEDYFEIDLVNQTLKPGRAVAAPLFIQYAFQPGNDPTNHSDFQQIYETPMDSIMRFDADNDYRSIMNFIRSGKQGLSASHSFLPMYRLLLKNRFISAYVVSFAIPRVKHAAVFMARGIGGILNSKPEDVRYGLNGLNGLPERELERHYDLLFVPAFSYLIRHLLDDTNKNHLSTVLDFLKAAVPRFRSIVDWDLADVNGTIYNCSKKLF